MQKGSTSGPRGKENALKFLDEMVMTFNRLSKWTVSNSDQTQKNVSN